MLAEVLGENLIAMSSTPRMSVDHFEANEELVDFLVSCYQDDYDEGNEQLILFRFFFFCPLRCQSDACRHTKLLAIWKICADCVVLMDPKVGDDDREMLSKKGFYDEDSPIPRMFQLLCQLQHEAILNFSLLSAKFLSRLGGEYLARQLSSSSAHATHQFVCHQSLRTLQLIWNLWNFSEEISYQSSIRYDVLT